jgi:Fe-S-cluster containining protein
MVCVGIVTPSRSGLSSNLFMPSPTPNPDAPLVAALSRAYERFDQQAQRWLEAYTREGGTVHCAMGCLHCCNLPIQVSLLEALLTAASLSATQLDAMRVRAFQVIENARGATSWNEYVQRHRVQLGYCPLLDRRSGACGAYGVRPARCRDTFSAMNARFCQVGTLEGLNRRERQAYDREVRANPVMDGVTHYIAPLEDLGEAMWTVAGRAMRSAWGAEVWGDFWVLTALTQDEPFMTAVRGAQLRRALSRAKKLGLWHVEIVRID